MILVRRRPRIITVPPVIGGSGGGGVPTLSQFWNSTEPGGGDTAPGGISSDCLLADDLSRGWWSKADAEGWDQGNNTVDAPSNARIFTGSPTAVGNIQYTAGYEGTIYSGTSFHPSYGPGTCVLVNQRGAVYAATHGTQPLPEGADLMAAHDLSRTVSEFYARYDAYFPADYEFGAEKILTVNHAGDGPGGIIWGNLHSNLGAGSRSTSGSLAWQSNGLGGTSSYSGLFTLTRGRWVSIQLYCKRVNGAGSDLLRVWADDLGSDGTSVPSGGNPTLRLNRTDYSFVPAGGGATTFGSLFLESWANPGSSGSWKWTNLKVHENNGGSNGNSPILIRAAA